MGNRSAFYFYKLLLHRFLKSEPCTALKCYSVQGALAAGRSKRLAVSRYAPGSAIQGHPSPNLASSMLRPRPLLASCSITVNPGPRASPTILISRRLSRLLRAAFIVLLQPHQTTLSRVPPPFHSPIGSCCPTARGTRLAVSLTPRLCSGPDQGRGFCWSHPLGAGPSSQALPSCLGGARLGSARFAARVGVGG